MISAAASVHKLNNAFLTRVSRDGGGDLYALTARACRCRAGLGETLFTVDLCSGIIKRMADEVRKNVRRAPSGILVAPQLIVYIYWRR